jgi:hypothetical protein
MSKLAYDDSWEQEFASEGHGNWRDQNLLPETKAIMEENERIRAERKARQESRGTLQFSEPLAIEICERVSSGELLINICLDEHMPTVRRVTQWLRESPEFAALYKDSICDRLTIFEEEVIKIADDDAIARAKLRVEVRLKHLKAYKPSIWGEQSTLNVKQSDPLDLDQMTTEELAAKIAELEHKDRVVNEDRRSVAA